MDADPGQGTIEDELIVLDEVRDHFGEPPSAEGLLRSLAAQGNVDAREAVAFLVASRSQRTQP
jgi:hypothetical protein